MFDKKDKVKFNNTTALNEEKFNLDVMAEESVKQKNLTDQINLNSNNLIRNQDIIKIKIQDNINANNLIKKNDDINRQLRFKNLINLVYKNWLFKYYMSNIKIAQPNQVKEEKILIYRVKKN